MPLPLIPIIIGVVSLIAGGGGVVLVHNAKDRIGKARRRHDRWHAKYDKAREAYEDKRHETERAFEKLGRIKLESCSILLEAVKFLKKAKLKDRELEEKCDVRPETLRSWEAASVNALDILGGLATSGAAGAGTAAGVYGLVGLLGSASTGTAISALSGAAATNATLAWLGGGAIAVGGGGIAVGTYVVGGAVAGPAILVAGFFAQSKAEDVETKVEKNVAKMMTAMEEISRRSVGLDQAIIRAREIGKSIKRVGKSLTELLVKCNPEVMEDAYKVAKTAKSLASLLDTSILDKDGKLITE